MSLPTPVLYRSTEVLAIHPNTIDGARRETLSASDEGVAGVHGAVVRSWPDAPPEETRSLEWTCKSRDELAALEDFLSRRRGRRTAFWCSTYRQDAIVTATDANWVEIGASAYRAAFPAIAAARNGLDHWMGQRRNGTQECYAVSAVSSISGTTDRLAFPASVTAPQTTAQGTLWSRLELVRLADDTIRTRYLTGAVATVSVSITTIPRETP